MRPPATDPAVSLFVPTWNAGPEFPEILDRMLGQDLDRSFEVVVIDSGSTDGTAELLARRPVRLYRIPNADFDHGLTRNRGIEEAQGDIVVLATQDARPANEQWMQRLVDCFDEPEVAGAFSRQQPRPDASPLLKDRLASWVAGNDEPRVQEIATPADFDALSPLERLDRVAFDNVSSAVRKRVMRDIPFRARRFGEDIDWAKRAILAGHKLVFEPRSVVIHSHAASALHELKRIYADHANLKDLLGVHTIPTAEALVECILHRAWHYLGVVEADAALGLLARLAWTLRVPAYAIAENLGQFLGARSVGRLARGRPAWRLLDRLLRRGV